MASLFHPRMRDGVGHSDADKEIINDNIRESNIEIAAVEIAHPHEQQQQQPEQVLALHKKSNNNLLQKMTYLMRESTITLMKMYVRVMQEKILM